ncbi:MAG: mechanosensitive ion channel [Gammaproteobacteria bacterium]|nr:mechanosensitive ion channel [Gammaproteobacteria bacterium]
MPRLLGTLFCSALASLPLLAGTAYGANPLFPAATPPATTEKPAAPAVEPIAPADIAMRADTDERLVQEIMARARQADPARRLEPQLDELANGVRKLSETFKRDELQSLPVIRLESLDRHWRFYDKHLAEWRNDLQRITSRYSEDAAELAKRKAVWETTLGAAQANGVPPALVERVQSILAQITRTQQALSEPLEEQLRLARRGNAVQQAIDAGKKGVDAAIKYFDQRLRMIDAPPLWEAWRDSEPSQHAVSTLLVGLQIERDFLVEYNAMHALRQNILHAVALVLLPLLVWLSRRSRRLVSDDTDLQESARVLLRPISAWLVLVLVGVLFFEPDAPMLRHQVALLLALIPVLRLLPRKVYAVLGPWPYIVTVLYILDQLGFMLVGAPLLLRLHGFLIGVLTLGTLLWLLLRRDAHDRGAIEPRQRMVVRSLGWLGVAGLVVAVVANVVGNVSLAEALTGGILDSGYIGLALYAGANVLSAILKLLLARKGITRFRVVTQHTGPLLQSLGRLINFVALVTWVVIVLNEFRIYRPVAKWLTAVLTYPIEAGAISVTLGSILLFLASVWVAFWLARTIRVVLRDDVLPNMQLPRGVGNSISTLTYYAIVTLGVMVALAAAGFHISQLALIIGALGVGIGLGLQNVVNNFVSGLILMFERPIQPGDVVEVSGISGKVREIGMRATTLTTFEGADVVVPNGTLLSANLVNWTLSDMSRRLDVNVGVAYGNDPKRVLELLMQVAKSTPGVAASPEPSVLFVGFGASSLDFGLRAWTHDFGNWVAIRSEMTVRVYEALRAAGIEIPFPQQDLHLRSVSPQARVGLAGVGTAPDSPPAG